MTNGEKFKTVKERNDAFICFCKKNGGCRNCRLSSCKMRCSFVWLSIEEEEEKPLACPLCGGEAVAVQPWLTGGASVMCKKCGTFIWAPTQAEAIATWNRSAK